MALTYYTIAQTNEEQGNKEAAVNNYLNALKFDSNLKEVYYSLGVTYDTINQKENAIKYYNKYLSKSQNVQNELTDYAKQRLDELTN